MTWNSCLISIFAMGILGVTNTPAAAATDAAESSRTATAKAVAATTALAAARSPQPSTADSAPPYQVEVLLEDLHHPWAIAFISAEQALVTERRGQLHLVNLTDKTKQEIQGVPEVVARGQGGLLDILLDQNFQENNTLFLTYAGGSRRDNETRVARARLDREGLKLTDLKVIWRQKPSYTNALHFGSRLVQTKEGWLFLGLGDRFSERDQAQQLNSHLGKVVRIDREGRPVPGNPFAEQEGALPEIWSLGHRNIQGAALHPETQELWIHEHGPRGGDEVNVVRAGKNYGWPVVTFGREYHGPRIGEGTHKEGMEPPLHHWTPSIAPSGMSFYTGQAFPQWQGNLFVGALRDRALHRLEFKGEKLVSSERLLSERRKRIRDVRQGPDGFLYVLTDENPGELLRLKPAERRARPD